MRPHFRRQIAPPPKKNESEGSKSPDWLAVLDLIQSAAAVFVPRERERERVGNERRPCR